MSIAMDGSDATATCQCGCRSRDGEMIEAIAKAIEAEAIRALAKLQVAGASPRATYFVDGMTKAASIVRGAQEAITKQ